MKKWTPLIYHLLAFILLMSAQACNMSSSDTDAIDTDSTSIANGRLTFQQECSGCHSFKNDGIGPKLSGITESVPVGWIESFIRNPQKYIEGDDARAKTLWKKYHTVMPSFEGLPEEKINDVIAYLHTQKSTGEKETDTGENDNSIKDPIPQKIEASGLTVNLELVTQIPPSSDNKPLTRITKLGYQPGSRQLFVLDLRGKIYGIKNGQPQVYFDIKQLRKDFIDKPGLGTGLGSFAFHPDFAKNGLFYTTHTVGPKTAKADLGYHDSIPVEVQWVLTEWKAEKPGVFPFKGQGRELLRVNMVTGVHGIQEIAFNPGAKKGDEDYGLLYICIGDGGCSENGYPFLAHNKKNPWGTILRIDPRGNNSRNGKYGIPSTNPFTGDSTSLKEIYAYGFRNPHRITWSRAGQMMAVNIGCNNIESIYYVFKGHDYGWPIREGSFVFNVYGNTKKVYALPPDDAQYKITYPVAEYDHDEGNAISGGYEYGGASIPALKGKFLFGDIPNGRLFYVEMKDLKQGSSAPVKEWQVAYLGKTMPLRQLCENRRVDLRFGQDSEGELYILTKPDGKVYKLTGVDGIGN